MRRGGNDVSELMSMPQQKTMLDLATQRPPDLFPGAQWVGGLREGGVSASQA